MGEGEDAVELEVVQQERDLGVLTDNKLKFSEHINACVNSANQKVSGFKRGFEYKTKNVFNKLYKSFIRPSLEYGHAVWYPRHIQDFKAIESVQRNATRLVTSLEELEYEARLRELHLPSMKYRLERGDMVEVWRILHDQYDGDFPWIKPVDDSHTRGNGLKVEYNFKSSSYKRNVLSFRAHKSWRSLPPQVANAPTLNQFKNGLDRFWASRMFEYYGP